MTPGTAPIAPSKALLPFLGSWRLVKAEMPPNESWREPIKSGITTLTQEQGGLRYKFDGDGSQESFLFQPAETWDRNLGTLSFEIRQDGSLEAKECHGSEPTPGTTTTFATIGFIMSVSADGQTLTTQQKALGAYDIWNTTTLVSVRQASSASA